MAKTRTIVRYRSKAKRTHRKAGFTLPLAAVAGFAPLVINAVDRGRRDGAMSGVASVSQGLTGYNPQSGDWKLSRLTEGLLPIMIGLGVHKLAGKFGINRMLGQAKVPFIRI